MSTPTARTLRPGAESFRRSGWLPKSKEASDAFFSELKQKCSSGLYRSFEVELLPPVQAFKNFIERDPNVYLEFQRMFDNIPKDEHPSNYMDLINSFNEIFRQAPEFGSLGPPMYMIMANIMNSQGGFSAFTKENLNFHFKEMLITWNRYLNSSASRSVLNKTDKGWLGTKAIEAMLKDFKAGRTFDQVFVCNTEDEFYGYQSFEDFFNRRLANPQDDRPTGPLEDLRLISAACESTSYAYQENVKKMDPLFIKDEAYSLHHLLAGNFVEEFDGATVLQGFLNTTSYHRWHAPCNGTIRKIVDVPGTYFAQGPYTIGESTEDPKVAPPYLQSLRYFANTAARQLIFIDAQNPVLGLMCFIAIGMTEISSTEATVFEGQKVKRGEQLGMFHFGGSSSALVFRKSSKVMIDKKFQVPEAVLKINEPIGVVPV